MGVPVELVVLPEALGATVAPVVLAALGAKAALVVPIALAVSEEAAVPEMPFVVLAEAVVPVPVVLVALAEAVVLALGGLLAPLPRSLLLLVHLLKENRVLVRRYRHLPLRLVHCLLLQVRPRWTLHQPVARHLSVAGASGL